MREQGPSSAQQGLGDMEAAEFRQAAREVADRVADYLDRLESYPVLPDLQPGEIRSQLADDVDVRLPFPARYRGRAHRSRHRRRGPHGPADRGRGGRGARR